MNQSGMVSNPACDQLVKGASVFSLSPFAHNNILVGFGQNDSNISAANKSNISGNVEPI